MVNLHVQRHCKRRVGRDAAKCIIFLHGATTHSGQESHYRGFIITHHSRQDSSGRVISSSQRSLPDNTRHSQQTNIHAPGGIRTRNPSKRAAAERRLRPCGHWDRRKIYRTYNVLSLYFKLISDRRWILMCYTILQDSIACCDNTIKCQHCFPTKPSQYIPVLPVEAKTSFSVTCEYVHQLPY